MKSKRLSKPRKSAWKGLKPEDLGQKIKDRFQWECTPREFQLETIEAQLLRKDVLVQVRSL